MQKIIITLFLLLFSGLLNAEDFINPNAAFVKTETAQKSHFDTKGFARACIVDLGKTALNICSLGVYGASDNYTKNVPIEEQNSLGYLKALLDDGVWNTLSLGVRNRLKRKHENQEPDLKSDTLTALGTLAGKDEIDKAIECHFNNDTSGMLTALSQLATRIGGEAAFIGTGIKGRLAPTRPQVKNLTRQQYLIEHKPHTQQYLIEHKPTLQIEGTTWGDLIGFREFCIKELSKTQKDIATKATLKLPKFSKAEFKALSNAERTAYYEQYVKQVMAEQRARNQ